MRSVSGSAAAVAVTIALVSGPARAQAPDGNKITAEALFEDARKLVADKNYSEACSKFADSERLDPSAATLLNLASCWEKLGRTATAWATYKEAASMANAAGRRDYVTAAERHADALTPTLARLTINVTTPVDGIQILRDGARVEHAEWGTAIPIDPGSHALQATAPGYKDWSSAVEVAPNSSQVVAVVPPLEAAPVSQTPSAAGEATSTAFERAASGSVARGPTTGKSEPAGGGQRIAGLIVGGIGIAGAAIGAGFAVAAKNKFSQSVDHCEAQDHNVCSAVGLSERSDARSEGDIATVAVIVGGAAIAGGLALWLTAPKATKREESGRNMTLVLTPNWGGATLKGAW